MNERIFKENLAAFKPDAAKDFNAAFEVKRKFVKVQDQKHKTSFGNNSDVVL